LKLSKIVNQVPEKAYLFIRIGICEKNGTGVWIYIRESINDMCEIGRYDISGFFDIVKSDLVPGPIEARGIHVRKSAP
jgi:hypothetical protein